MSSSVDPVLLYQPPHVSLVPPFSLPLLPPPLLRGYERGTCPFPSTHHTPRGSCILHWGLHPATTADTAGSHVGTCVEQNIDTCSELPLALTFPLAAAMASTSLSASTTACVSGAAAGMYNVYMYRQTLMMVQLQACTMYKYTCTVKHTHPSQ